MHITSDSTASTQVRTDIMRHPVLIGVLQILLSV